MGEATYNKIFGTTGDTMSDAGEIAGTPAAEGSAGRPLLHSLATPNKGPAQRTQASPLPAGVHAGTTASAAGAERASSESLLQPSPEDDAGADRAPLDSLPRPSPPAGQRLSGLAAQLAGPSGPAGDADRASLESLPLRSPAAGRRLSGLGAELGRPSEGSLLGTSDPPGQTWCSRHTSGSLFADSRARVCLHWAEKPSMHVFESTPWLQPRSRYYNHADEISYLLSLFLSS